MLPRVDGGAGAGPRCSVAAADGQSRKACTFVFDTRRSRALSPHRLEGVRNDEPTMSRDHRYLERQRRERDEEPECREQREHADGTSTPHIAPLVGTTLLPSSRTVNGSRSSGGSAPERLDEKRSRIAAGRIVDETQLLVGSERSPRSDEYSIDRPSIDGSSCNRAVRRPRHSESSAVSPLPSLSWATNRCTIVPRSPTGDRADVRKTRSVDGGSPRPGRRSASTPRKTTSSSSTVSRAFDSHLVSVARRLNARAIESARSAATDRRSLIVAYARSHDAIAAPLIASATTSSMSVMPARPCVIVPPRPAT